MVRVHRRQTLRNEGSSFAPAAGAGPPLPQLLTVSHCERSQPSAEGPQVVGGN